MSTIGPGNAEFDDAVARIKASLHGEGRKPAKRARERGASGAKVTPKAKDLAAPRATRPKRAA